MQLTRSYLKQENQNVVVKFPYEYKAKVSNLVAVNLHDRCPSPISTPKISQVTVNGSKYRINFKRNKLTLIQPDEYKETS